MHLAIYKARPDVKSVVHSHPPHATAFAIAGVELPTCIHPEAEVFLGAVRTAKYVTPGDTRLGESLLPYVQDANTILLQNHGTVTFSATLEEAYYKLEIVDAYSRILLLAKQVGDPPARLERDELLDLKVRFGTSTSRAEGRRRRDDLPERLHLPRRRRTSAARAASRPTAAPPRAPAPGRLCRALRGRTGRSDVAGDPRDAPGQRERGRRGNPRADDHRSDHGERAVEQVDSPRSARGSRERRRATIR